MEATAQAAAPSGANFQEQAALTDLFSHHAPTEESVAKMQTIRDAGLAFARVLTENCPRSADRTTAIRMARDAVMWGNASIALNGATQP